ncbi:MAG: hypothetical protein L6R41_006452 [Letrouitia leprolyta]|nr:MAG: hypothetical protein L6R41_006452 [Letrouitia leprolyta]
MSLRSRFGRLLGRSSDSGQRASEEHPTTIHSQADSPLNSASEARREPSLSPRKLHKAASTTFQAFSDTLRSRAQAFYASPNPADVHRSRSPEPKLPKVSPRRAAIWSSVRSRGSRSTDGHQSSLDPELEAPVSVNLPSIGPAPRLNIDFPSSSLQDPNEDDILAAPSVTPNTVISTSSTRTPTGTGYYKPQKQWPSPHMHLRSLSLVKTAAPSTKIAPALSDEVQPTVAGKAETTDKSDHSTTSENGTEAVEMKPKEIEDHTVEAKTFSDDTGYVSDTESNTETITTRPSTVATLGSKPPSSNENPHASGRVFESGAQSNEDFQGTFWPAGKVLKSSKRSSRSSTGNEIFLDGVHGHMDQSMASTVAGSNSALSFEQVPDHEVFTCTPLLKISRVTSEAYEADTEADTINSQTANMGSREAWAEARDDRAKRYAALQLEETNMDTSTDEDSDFGVELTTSPSLPHGLELSGKVTEQINRPPVEELAALRKNLEARSFHQNSSENLSGPSEELDADMSPSPKNEYQEDVSQNTHTATVVPLDQYLADKTLRHMLLSGKKDFVLEATLGTNTSTDRFLITSQLDLEDPFEAAVASFGGPSWASDLHDNENNDDLASEGHSLFDLPRRKFLVESSAWPAYDPKYSIPIPLPSMHAHTQPIHRRYSLLKRMGQSLMSKQRHRNGNGESDSQMLEQLTTCPPPLEENKQDLEPSPFKITSSVSTDNWEKQIFRFGADSTLGRAVAQENVEAIYGELTLEILNSNTSEHSASSDSEDSSTPPGSPDSFEKPSMRYRPDSILGRFMGCDLAETNEFALGLKKMTSGTSEHSISDKSEHSSTPVSTYTRENPRVCSNADSAFERALTFEMLTSRTSECSISDESELSSTPLVSTYTREDSMLSYDADPPLGRTLALETLMSRTSEHSISSDSEHSEDSDSLCLERGRPRGRGNSSRRSSSSVRRSGLGATRSSLHVTKRRGSSAYAMLPSSGYRTRNRMSSYASRSRRDSHSRTPSYLLTSRGGSFDQTRWLEEHYRMLDEQIARDCAREKPKEPRQRLADVSMVERRRELNRKASYEALCQFIYQCERESEAEEAREAQEEEEGYTSAMFQG